MKKMVFGIVLLCLLMSFATGAVALEIECVQSNALGGDQWYSIKRAMMDNGQTIYFLSREPEAGGLMEDVNFDGYDDFVPVIISGARNFIYAFFLYNPNSGQYEPLYGFDEGFCNYTLHPEKGYVVSAVSDGYQYGETKIYEWRDNTLVLLRRATAATVHTMEFLDDGYTERWDSSRYEMIVYDHTTGVDNGQITYHQIYPDDDPQFEEHQELLNAAFWSGL